ncbi:MAG: universal stress protein [Candidatus Nezhaarchaeota archaeon]|nr:universal stress protein [Candidatus Nezhaarchaeota archaeon]MCX8141455.1 universal stress protein [Candidatus Nezhaarchaeota archaeon]MDW8049721.1 universal stress protein [Nitrososphaerota archaeon]
MSKVRKILVGIDGSAISYKAAEVALDLASDLNAEVTAVHVIPPLPADYVLLGARFELDISELDRKLMHEVRIMALSKKVKLDTKIVRGGPSEVITSMAESEGYDMIVLGCTGIGGAYRRLMGSVSAEVVNTSKKPVLLVK